MWRRGGENAFLTLDSEDPQTAPARTEEPSLLGLGQVGEMTPRSHDEETLSVLYGRSSLGQGGGATRDPQGREVRPRATLSSVLSSHGPAVLRPEKKRAQGVRQTGLRNSEPLDPLWGGSGHRIPG